ncbi:hypothetical protein BHE74_00010454 [Ensete ventricosum]|nr:hypothetical protein GW17_00034403 [Ensete ventricosum]RWW81173.1 hypothetical protein BHE74_00010454 [Ensete ventricosum]
MGRQQRLMGSGKALQWMPSGSRGWQWQEYDSGPRLAAEDLRWCSLLARDADSKEGRDNGGEEEWQLLLQVAVKRRLRQRRLRDRCWPRARQMLLAAGDRCWTREIAAGSVVQREIAAGRTKSLLAVGDCCRPREISAGCNRSLLVMTKSLLAASKADSSERSLLAATKADGDERSLLEALCSSDACCG